MSGHSKWATIKRAKAANDAARGKVFSKLARNISIAVKEGGGNSPDSNYRLRVAIDAARAANMPKDNIERAISKGSGGSDGMVEVIYEGFGPGGVGIIIETSTDNKNRTAQEVKNLLERSGGSLGGPNAVSFNFESKGYIRVDNVKLTDDLALLLIDAGVDEYEESEGGIDIYTNPHELFAIRQKIENQIKLSVSESSLIKRPLTPMSLSSVDEAKLADLVEKLEELENVDQVFVGA